MRSLQRRLSVWLSVAILIGGVAAAAASFFAALHDAGETQDAHLIQVGEVFAAGQTTLPVPPSLQPKDREEAEESRFVVATLGVPSKTSVDVAFPESLTNGFHTLVLKHVEWRVLVLSDVRGKRIAVAQNMRARDEDALSSAIYVLVPLALLVPVLLLAVHVIVRRAFAPITALAVQADRIGEHDLVILRHEDVPSEVRPFVQAVNRLLGRLSAALDQQRRLVADAAHELRSPVAALVVQGENLHHVVRDPEARARLRALRDGLGRMASLLEQLLSLARIQGAVHVDAKPVAFDQAIVGVIEDLLPLAESKQVDLGSARMDALLVEGDAQQIRAIVRNAIDNAVRYAPEGSAVDVALDRVDDHAVFTVQDEGPGIAPNDVARVFDPFVRVLGSQQAGSGLGLAIAKAAAASLGGSIALSPRPDGRRGLLFTYRQVAIGDAKG